MQSAYDDNETLEPHPGVHAHANKIDDKNIITAALEPEELRRKRITKKHPEPPVPPVGTENAVIERKLFVLVSAIPCDEELHRVRITNDRSSQQNDFRHFVDMLRRNNVMKFVNGSRWNEQREHHCKPPKDRARDEVGWKNRRVPRWNN